MKYLLIPVLAVMFPHLSHGLGPHEVLVLVNTNSRTSVAVAEHFVRIRHVPAPNVVHVGVPLTAAGEKPEITYEDFTRHVWTPAVEAMTKRGLDRHILAWVYSTDFPIRTKSYPAVSILGLTFLRNKKPERDDVLLGRYASPLFAGPSPGTREVFGAQSFDVSARWLGDSMPLPSIMLGYTGERGNTKGTVLRCLDRAAAADGTAPTGTVYFVVTETVKGKPPEPRSECRKWQFPSARNELVRLGISSVIVNRFPAGSKDIAGLMMGSAHVPSLKGCRLIPGCMPEHLTSCAAMFDSPNQTKLSHWIDAGAAASCGTVTEPKAIWTKFPTARFFVHYASGCTLMESFFQSVRCPLQILLVGDPLCAPWSPRAGITLEGPGDKSVRGSVSLKAAATFEAAHAMARYVFLVDGKMVAGPARSGDFTLDTRTLENGVHTVRAVAYRTGAVRTQGFAEKTFVVKN